jgi:hypothetical protein
MVPIPIIIEGLSKAVPAIIKLIGGDKAGKAAEKVASIAESVTGKKAEDAVAAIQADPALAIQFEKAVMDNDAEIYRLQLLDVQNARGRDVEVRKISGGVNWRADILAIGALAGLVALIYTLLFVHIPDGPARDVLLLLSGALVAIVKDVYQFEFGSSRGSREKDRLFEKK